MEVFSWWSAWRSGWRLAGATLVREIVASHEDSEAADLAEYWMARQPGSVQLVRGPDGEVLGLVGTVALQEVTEADRRRDVAVDRACSFLDSASQR